MNHFVYSDWSYPNSKLNASEWLHLLPLVQSALKNALPRQRLNVASVTTILGLKPSPPIHTFFRSEKSTSMTLSDFQRGRSFNVDQLC